MKTFLALAFALVASVCHGATIPAASSSRTDVQAAVNLAVSGDTVTVPSGLSSWNPEVTITGKRLTVLGAGIGHTIILDNGNGAFQVFCSLANQVRISGFEFRSGANHHSSGLIDVDGPSNAAGDQVGYRVDHCKLTIADGDTRGIVTVNTYGLIDFNYFDVSYIGQSIQSISPFGSSDGSDGGFTPWRRPLVLGSTNCTFIENNTFAYTVGIANVEDCIDGYGGARLTIRSNYFLNSHPGFHGTDSGNRRSAHSFEVYSNNYVNNSAFTYRTLTVRGGTGVVFWNSYGGTQPVGGVTLMYYRASTTLDSSTWQRCDGTAWELGSINLSAGASRVCSTTGGVRFCGYDKETIGTVNLVCVGSTFNRPFDGPGISGRPGRDQPGVTTGQNETPIYVWNNGTHTAGTYDGGTPTVGNRGIDFWIIAGKHYSNNFARPGYIPMGRHPLTLGDPVVSGPPPSGWQKFLFGAGANPVILP